MKVSIRCGEHPEHKYEAREAEELLEQFFPMTGMDVDIEGTVSVHRRGKKHTRRIYVVEDKISRIIMRVKPGKNGSCFLISITVPAKYSGQSEQLFMWLRAFAEIF